MANTSSAQKAMRQAQRRAARNQSARSAVRTYFKNASGAVAGTLGDAAEVVREAVSALDKAAQRGIIHRNAAARRKSRLMGRLHQLSLTKAEPAGDTTKTSDAKAKPAARKSTSKSTATAERKPAARKPAAKKAPSKSKT